MTLGERVIGANGTDDVAIDGEFDALAGPVDGVLVETVLVAGIVLPDGTVEDAVPTSSKEVGLHLTAVAADPFPINLVQTIRQHHDTAHDALSWGGLDFNLEMAEHDVELRLDGWVLALFVDGEGDAVFAVGRLTAVAEETIGGACELEVGGTTEGRVVGTCCDESATFIFLPLSHRTYIESKDCRWNRSAQLPGGEQPARLRWQRASSWRKC